MTGQHAAAALPEPLRRLLGGHGLVLTANARAARALERRYAQEQRQAGLDVWPSPQILDVHTWLITQWHTLLLTGTEDRILLSDLQEQAVWTAILEPQLAGRSLIQPGRLAAQARQAYALLAEYAALAHLDGRAWLTEATSEPELFRRWAQSFEQRCERERWVAACALPDAIGRAMRFGQLAAPPEVGWLGFDRVTPAQRLLQDAMEAAGSRIRPVAWPLTLPAEPLLYPAPSEEQEMRACAAWLELQLMHRPHARIGVLLPDVSTRRASLERALHHALQPQRFPIDAGAAAPALPFEFSLGQPLADVPLIRAALLLLRWLAAPLSQAELTWLLLSGMVSWGATSTARDELARWDARQRNGNNPAVSMSLDTYLSLLPEGDAPRHAARALASMRQQARRTLRAARPGAWTERVQTWLRAAGWSARSEASSLLFQAGEAWNTLLERMAALDLVTGRLTYTAFLEMLGSAAREAIFAPESEDAPVQVMGVLAAAGQQFDAVWFLNVTETAWPPPGRPHPLLPVSLQRELAMPYTAPEQETALAHAILEGLVHTTPGERVVSYAVQTGEAEQRPSALIRHFPLFAAAETPAASADLQLESVPDDVWVALAGDAASGGQNILQQQANCPFQAFAVRRLHARELALATRGLSALQRGTLLHGTLQQLWRELRSHASLLACRDGGTLHTLVAQHVTRAVAAFRTEQEEAWRSAYLYAEEDRLIDLVVAWLHMECTRTPFEVVSVEETTSVAIGGLTLNLRLDRVDEVEGRRLILDYKTGEVSLKGWEGDRPEQPQLPLYAAFANKGELAGALFAQVRPTKIRLLGRVNDPTANLGMDSSKDLLPLTEEGIAAWREALERLAARFRAGEAAVDPHRYPATCKFCSLPGLCRVAQARPAQSDESSDEEDLSPA